METLIALFLKHIAPGLIVNFTSEGLIAAFKYAMSRDKSLVERMEAAGADVDKQRKILGEVGVICARAADGAIEVDNATLEALRIITFDHERGFVDIQGSEVSAPKVQIGGDDGSSGVTRVTDSELKGGGSKISIGKGANIRASGGAKITLT